jgi:gamma-glutamylcyclotransferase (GGCT)/AIG2-like uncharacterized protein YtfP
MNPPDEASTLFVYGSLVYPVCRCRIIGRPVETSPAEIRGYTRARARYFYIRRHPGVITKGLLLLNLTPEEFIRLDLYEEVPRLYTREKTEVHDATGNALRCWVYLPTALTMSCRG